MTKKHSKMRGQKKGKRKTITGLDRPFFLGGDSKLAGFIHYKPPRWTDEYANMEDRDLFRRIRDDLEELLARAYPTYNDEWQQQFAPNYWREFPITYAAHLRTVINESVAESLCLGLMKRMTSPSLSERRKALTEYRTLVDQLEPKHAANALAFIASWLTTYLENLFVKRPALMREVAAKYDLWPVNLGLSPKIIKGKRKHQVTRLGFARNYLTELELNSRCEFPSGHESGAQRASPFKLAAQDLYRTMLLEKDSHLKPGRHNAWSQRRLPLEFMDGLGNTQAI